MEFATSSDSTLSSVFYVTLAFFGASASCMFLCFFIRLRRQHLEARSQHVEAQWRDFCFQALMTPELEKLPPMDQRDLFDLVEIWLQTFDRIRGSDAAKGLVRMGQYLDFGNRLLPWLNSDVIDRKVLAIMALGLLKDRRALHLIQRYIDDTYPLVSLAAMKAYMDIDPEHGLPELLKRIDRPGWPIGRVRQLMSLAPRNLQTSLINLSAETLNTVQIPKLFELVYALAPTEASDPAQIALRRFPDSAPILMVILKHTTDPQFIPLIRVSCNSRYPELRHVALMALGRLGDASDQARLIHALNHDTWLNQQAAANSLMTVLPDMSVAQGILTELASESARLHWSELLFKQGLLTPQLTNVWISSNTTPRIQVAYAN